MVNMELKSEFGLWLKTILNLGSETSYGTNKYVIDCIKDDTENLADPQEEPASQSSVKVIAANQKLKQNHKRREPVDVPSIIPMNERKWIDIEPSEPSLAAYEVSKKVISQSSSTRSNSTTRRRRSSSILENQRTIFRINFPHGPRLYVCQAPNAFICVSSVAPPKHQMRLYVCHQMRLYVCHQMRLHVCHQMRLYVCHQMRSHVCHFATKLASLAYLCRFARTFF